MFRLTLCFLSLFIFVHLSAQQVGEIFGLEFKSAQLKLAKVNPLNGQVSVISPSPTSGDQFGSGISDIDPIGKRYFYIRAGQIITVDLQNGQVLYTRGISCPTHNVSWVQPISNIQYNWVDSTIYGLLHYQQNLWFAKIDPSTGVMTVLSAGPISGDQYQSGVSDIDPMNGRYFFVRANSIVTVDIASAQITSSPRLSNLNNAVSPITNIAYDWLTDQIFGLNYVGSQWNNNGTITKPAELRLATVNPSTGLVSIISSNVLSSDQFQSGVSDIDPVAGLYYYVRRNEIISVDLGSGSIVYRNGISNPNQAISPITNIEVLKDIQSNPAPSASFVTTVGTNEVQFKNTSDYAKEVHWDFGDGTTSDARHPSHWYQFRGEYEVSMTVHNKEGDSEMLTKTITITGPHTPESNFNEGYYAVLHQKEKSAVHVIRPADFSYSYFELFDIGWNRVFTTKLNEQSADYTLPDLRDGEYTFRIVNVSGERIEGKLILD